MRNRLLKLFAGIGVLFLALTVVGSFIGVGMMARHAAIENENEFRNRVAQAEQAQSGAAAQNSEQFAEGQQQQFEERQQRGDRDRFEGRGERGRGDHDHHGHRGHRHGGFLWGIFGLLGGLIRLAGLGLLVLAAVLFWRGRGGQSASNNDGDNGDDDGSEPAAPDMTEAEIRAAMKRLGIDKIEL